MVAWPKVTRPIQLGGLGVPDLAMLRHVLRLRGGSGSPVSTRAAHGRPCRTKGGVEQALFKALVSILVGSGDNTWF
jgi:hypothetical protein